MSSRSNFFYFTIKGNDLDPIALKKIVGLPCDTYFKGQKSLLTGGKEVESISTRWVYKAVSDNDIRTTAFLTKHLAIITKKLPILRNYIEKYDTLLDLVIYENRDSKNNVLLDEKAIKLLNKIDVKFSIAFF